ncbi:2-oxoacid:acceptor oxidoreductase family protein [Candidatus Woesearchaeota archaeon]|nr:2-oxoacid:acceptor oxidoreductase family protein [Candidatus Woesearchaeota archaeon]
MADKDIFEMVIIGRGGQGAKTASQFIAESALEQGKHVQAFPEYGPERAGAPMKAYARISDKAITTYAPVVNPDVVMVIDPTLLDKFDISESLGKEAALIVNSPKSADAIKKEGNFKCKVYSLDGTKISIDTVGKNLPNTPMLGAFVKLTGLLPLKAIEGCVRKKFLGKLGEDKTNATIKGIKMAYEAVV